METEFFAVNCGIKSNGLRNSGVCCANFLAVLKFSVTSDTGGKRNVAEGNGATAALVS